MSGQIPSTSSSQGAPGESAARRIVTFRVDDRTFGIDVHDVREIKGWQATTPLPHAQPHVLGVLNLRGVILAVYDLRATIGLGPTQASASHVIVVVSVGERTAGLLVDSVSDIVDVPPNAIRPVPDIERDERGLLAGLAILAEDIVALLDLAAIIRDGSTDEVLARHAQAA